MTSGCQLFTISLIVRIFPRDLDIFSLLMLTNPLWIQYRAKGFPVAASDCEISFSWCGKMRSLPPPWMSKDSPRYFWLITEHSICHPGRPFPQGVSLFLVDLNPGAGLHLFDVSFRKFSVAIEFFHGEEDISVARVGISLLD